MRIFFYKEIEFFIKKIFFSKSFLLKRKLIRIISNNSNNEETELELLKKIIIPKSDVIDIGVYRGVYTFEMSKYAKMVHSFEPNPLIFNYLFKNLRKIINNVTLYNFAISDKSKKVNLKIPIRNPNANKKNYEEYFALGRSSIHLKNTFQKFKTFKVYSKKIDDFIFSNKISFIKIDVEGHEKNVVKGCKKLIKKDKPVLLIEIEERYTKEKIGRTLRYINSLGYRSCFYKNKTIKFTKNSKKLNLIRNFLFIPKKSGLLKFVKKT